MLRLEASSCDDEICSYEPSILIKNAVFDNLLDTLRPIVYVREMHCG